MRNSIGWLVLLSLLDKGETSPQLPNSGNPLRGVWGLLKLFIFLFLLIWFLFHQDFVSLEVKPKRKNSQALPFAPESGAKKQDYYIVRNGQTLSEIAAQTGSSQKLLMSANHIKNPNRIYSGQRLIVPANRAAPPGE